MRSRHAIWLIAIFFGIAALIFIAAPARSQALCGPAPAVLRALLDHGEAVLMTATMMTGKIVVTRSHDGSWSVVTVIGGTACILMSGKKSELDRGV